MQTIKTAALVVLLVTVFYQAYISLTTPPEPLPANVEEMIVFDEAGNLDIDAGLPESLGNLDINDGLAAEGDADSWSNLASSDGSAMTAPTATETDSGPASSALAAIVPPTDPAATDPSVEGGFPPASQYAAGDTGSPDARLALANTAGVSVSLDSSAGSPTDPEYPSTSQTFDVPDPTRLPSPADFTDSVPADEIAPVAATTARSQPAPETSIDPNREIGLLNAFRTADRQYADDRRKDALATLSLFYNTPNLSGERRSELLSRLDPLAAEVIYSQRHLLESPHRVSGSETLVQIAEKYEVPWQLLANINQIDDPVTILPGTELKVVRGPFRAQVDIAQKEITLFLADLYAGRFPIEIGNDPAPKPGTYSVQDKQTSKTYYNRAGSPVPPASPNNPYGTAWIDLGGRLCIHGSPSSSKPSTDGCISLSGDHADDLYGILSLGSSIEIRP